MLERGLHVDHTTIYCWVQQYAPELEMRCHRISKPATTQGQVDETSIKIKKVWFYLYWAVDSEGNTLEFFLSPTCDAEAVTRFFQKALHSTADVAPQSHPVEEQMAQPATAANAATFAGGRAWYTALGHTSACFQDPLFLSHIWGGVTYAAGLESKHSFGHVENG